MTIQEFNTKYKKHLASRFYGLAIETPEVIAYLDEVFRSLALLYPDFIYYQIKTKMGRPVIYTDNVPNNIIENIQKELYEILKKHEQKFA